MGKIDEVIKWFGNQSETARALGVSPQAVFQWVQEGSFPASRALQIERLSVGKFKAIELAGMRGGVVNGSTEAKP